jgi:uncharacterized protein (DUF2147 family)
MRSPITTALAGIALAATALGPTLAAEPTGTWMSDNGRVTVRIGACGNALCGTIVAMKEPIDRKTGRPKTDHRNPDAAKRNRPMIGLPVVLAMKPSGPDKWSGQIYNADDGNTYAAHMTTTGPRSMKVEGCALAGLICRAQNWTKVN